MIELDHLFICVDNPESAAEQLINFGLVEGTSNVHPGQGTANRRFFFSNGFIELLYATDSAELDSELTKPTGLISRFSGSETDASPFGVCFRPADYGGEVPFPHWSYKPQYLPDHLDVKVGDAPVTEPMWFYLSSGSRPDGAPGEKRQPLEHRCGFGNITSVRACITSDKPASQVATIITRLPSIDCISGGEHLLTVEFDFGKAKSKKDFRPVMPLVFCW
jgi:hypothetical protein